MGKKSSPPKPPDYKAAAEAEATANRDLNQMQTFSNRPDLYTPWGSQTWQQQPVWDPTTQQYVTNCMPRTVCHELYVTNCILYISDACVYCVSVSIVSIV